MEKYQDNYLLEGDILLSEEQVSLLKGSAKDSLARGVVADVARLWPGGVVPYTINSNITGGGNMLITWAIQHWEANTPIRFVVRTTQANYVEFTGSTGNNSFVGIRGGKQAINFVQTAIFEGPLIHEIGHAVGLWHEQSRNDRDASIIINWSNIKPEVRHNFESYLSTGWDLGAFDFNSIMLYPSIISDPNFVYNTSAPAITRRDGSTYTGNQFNLSAGDIEAVNLIYDPTPIYARIEIENRRTFGSGAWDYWTYVDAYLRFYNDAACTQPGVPHPALRFAYWFRSTTTSSNGETNNDAFNSVVPTGNSTIPLGTNFTVERYMGSPSDPYWEVTNARFSMEQRPGYIALPEFERP